MAKVRSEKENKNVADKERRGAKCKGLDIGGRGWRRCGRGGGEGEMSVQRKGKCDWRGIGRWWEK